MPRYRLYSSETTVRFKNMFESGMDCRMIRSWSSIPTILSHLRNSLSGSQSVDRRTCLHPWHTSSVIALRRRVTWFLTSSERAYYYASTRSRMECRAGRSRIL